MRPQGFLNFSGGDLSDTLRAAWIEIWVAVGGMDVRTLGVSIGVLLGLAACSVVLGVLESTWLLYRQWRVRGGFWSVR